MLSVVMLNVIMLSVVMLSVIMLSVIMLSVIMLSVIMLSVLAPLSVLNPMKPTWLNLLQKLAEILMFSVTNTPSIVI